MDTVGPFVAIVPQLGSVAVRDGAVVIGPVPLLLSVPSVEMGPGETQDAWSLGPWSFDAAARTATTTVTSISAGKPRAHFLLAGGPYRNLVVIDHTLTSSAYTPSGTEFPEFAGLGASGNRPYAYISTTNSLAGRFIASQVDMETPGISGTRPATPFTYAIPAEGLRLNFFLNESDFGAVGVASFTIRLER